MSAKMSDARVLEKTKGFVAKGATSPVDRLLTVEGKAGSGGTVTVKPLRVGADMLLIEILQEKGTLVPQHQHDDHESMIYLVRGRMRLVINGEESFVQAGDAWTHPRGVPHYSEALEECLCIEVKSPPRKTW